MVMFNFFFFFLRILLPVRLKCVRRNISRDMANGIIQKIHEFQVSDRDRDTNDRVYCIHRVRHTHTHSLSLTNDQKKNKIKPHCDERDDNR